MSEDNPVRTHVQVIVMAVPWDQRRVRNVADMRTRVDGLKVVWDEKRDAWDTWVRSLAEAGESAAVFLEDDAELGKNWQERIEKVISSHPDDVIQFFSLARPGKAGLEHRPASSYLGNVCYYLPAGAAMNLTGFARSWHTEHPEHPTGCDLCIRGWLSSLGVGYLLHTPSLVQHRAWRSVIDRRRSTGRQSKSFQG